MATDSAGNLYAVWVDTANNNVYLSSSINQGTTWTTPVQVNGDPANSNVMPWAIGGAPGIVDIAFYGTASPGDPNSFPSWLVNRQAATAIKWFVYLVQVNGATTTTPIIYQVKASEHPTDYGQICTGGLGCTTSMGDRTLADFFTLAIDSNGAARIVVNDLTNQHHGASLFELTQVAGPSAYGTTLTSNNPSIATVTDPAGDAQLPHFSPLGAGANQLSLDLLSTQLSQPDTSHLTVTMKLNNLASLTPPTGATGILWLTRWQFNTTGDNGEESYRIFYLGANSTGGQPPVFFAGTGTSATSNPTGLPRGSGCVTTTPQNCKIIVYPAERPATGTINAATNTITITALLSNIGSPITGDKLYSVTTLTFGFTGRQPNNDGRRRHTSLRLCRRHDQNTQQLSARHHMQSHWRRLHFRRPTTGPRRLQHRSKGQLLRTGKWKGRIQGFYKRSRLQNQSYNLGQLQGEHRHDYRYRHNERLRHDIHDRSPRQSGARCRPRYVFHSTRNRILKIRNAPRRKHPDTLTPTSPGCVAPETSLV